MCALKMCTYYDVTYVIEVIEHDVFLDAISGSGRYVTEDVDRRRLFPIRDALVPMQRDGKCTR